MDVAKAARNVDGFKKVRQCRVLFMSSRMHRDACLGRCCRLRAGLREWLPLQLYADLQTGEGVKLGKARHS